MTKILKKVKLNAPASTSTGIDPTKGNVKNPYTWEEFLELLSIGMWEGGYVEGRGYIPRNVNVVGSSIMVVPASSDSFYDYPYWYFLPINENLHHICFDGGDEIELTDVNVQATINVYLLTVNVSVTKKGNYDINNLTVSLYINNNVQDDFPREIHPSTYNKYTDEFTFNLPENLHSPSISLQIGCNYNHDGIPEDDIKYVTIFPQ